MEGFYGVYRINGKLATENSSPGFRVYDEKLIRKKGIEYRLWDPYKSKLSAAILNGLMEFPFKKNSNVLYLGASSGTTASHISDICINGSIYCVELSKRMMRELIPVTMKKTNMVPILGDANHPLRYASNIGLVDIIYQDVSQKNQAEILLKNTDIFSPKYAMLIIKSRSINAIKSPKKVFREEIKRLKEKFDVLQIIELIPYDKDHVLVNLKSR